MREMSADHLAPAYSLAVHALLFFGVGFSAIHSPRFGVTAGDGGVEISLRAAPARRQAPALPANRSDGIETIQSVPQPSRSSEAAGDGSSASPGKDATTVESRLGAEASARPNYLRNPAPIYPERARAMSQEGAVVLLVSVTAEGRVKDLSVKSSSGFPLLDEAAIRAVRGWSFEAGRIGGVKIATNVEVPIRFRLDAAEE